MTAAKQERTSFDPWSRTGARHTDGTTPPSYLTERGHEQVDPWRNAVPYQAKTTGITPAPAPVQLLKPREPATIIAARRMLMYRKGLLPNEVEQLAGNRKQLALQAHWRWHGKRIGMLLAAGLVLALAGSLADTLPVLLAGYLFAFSGLVLGCAALATAIAILRKPLTSYYWREEFPATPEEVAILSRVAREHPELGQIIASWWSDPAPLRKRDVVMAQDFMDAMRGA